MPSQTTQNEKFDVKSFDDGVGSSGRGGSCHDEVDLGAYRPGPHLPGPAHIVQLHAEVCSRVIIMDSQILLARHALDHRQMLDGHRTSGKRS